MSNNPQTHLDKFLMKDIADGAGVKPTQPVLRFVAGATVVDNPAAGTTDVTVTATASGGQQAVTLVNGLNSDVLYNDQPTLRVTGPSLSFSIGGLKRPGGAAIPTGTRVVLINQSGQPLTIVNEDAGSAAIDRIQTLTGAPVRLPTRGSAAAFTYDGTALRWVLEHIGAIYPTVLHVRDFGAQVDGQTVTDGQMTAGSPNLHSSTATWINAAAPHGSVGKLVIVKHAGAAGVPLTGTILSVSGPNDCVLSASAATTTFPVATISAVSGNGTKTIAGVTNAKPAALNVVAHGYTTGDIVVITGTGCRGLDGLAFPISVVDADHFSVPARSGATSSTGTATNQTIRYTTSGAHGFLNGMYGDVAGCAGNTAANIAGQKLTVTGTTTFTLVGTGNGTYSSGGTVTGKGSQVDWGSDDYAAIEAACVAANTAGSYASVVQLGAGTSLLSQGLNIAGRNGINVRGYGRAFQGGQTYSRLALAAAAAYCVQVQALFAHLEKFWIDGNDVASTAALNVVYLTSDSYFEHLMVSGGAPDSGCEVNIPGVSEVDLTTFDHCSLFHDARYQGSPDKSFANFAINGNSNAFQILLRNMGMVDGKYGCYFLEGSASIENAQIFANLYAMIHYEAIQSAVFRGVYTERNNGVLFLSEGNSFAINGPPPLIVENCIINDNCEIQTGCKQPLILRGNVLAGDVVVSQAVPPMGGTPIGIFHVTDLGNTFVTNRQITGVLTQVEQLGGMDAPNTLDPINGYYTSPLAQALTQSRAQKLIVGYDLTIDGKVSTLPTVVDLIQSTPGTAGYRSNNVLLAWWNPDVGVTTDGSGNVSAWADQSGNGYNLTQATAIDRPGYTAPSGGARGFLTWTQATAAGMALATAGSAFGGTGLAEPFDVFCVTTISPTGATECPLFSTESASPYGLVVQDGAGHASHAYAVGGAGSIAFTFPTPKCVIGAQYTSGTSAIWSNGVSLAAASMTGAKVGPAFLLGNTATGGPASYNGTIGETLIFGDLTFYGGATFRAQVNAWLCGRNGIAVPAANPMAYACDSLAEPDSVVVNLFVRGMSATLPPPTVGRVIRFTDGSGVAASTAPITVLPNASETINGSNSSTLAVNWGTLTLRCTDGINWVAEQASGAAGAEGFAPLIPGVVAADGVGAIVSTLTITPTRSGNFTVTGQGGPGIGSSASGGIMFLTCVAHGGTATTALNAVNLVTTSFAVDGTGLAAMVTGLTVGVSYDISLHVLPTGDNWPTGSPAKPGGVWARETP